MLCRVFTPTRSNMAKSQSTCFISYSWDNRQHRDWVLRLGQDLLASGVSVALDHDVKPGESVTHFMEASIRDSDIVLVVCTPLYAEKANQRIGGVGYETGVVTGELYRAASSGKFVPIIRSGSFESALPTYLSDRLAIDFRQEDHYRDRLAELVKHCGGSPVPAALPPAVRKAAPAAKKKVRRTAAVPCGTVRDLSTAGVEQLIDQPEKPVVVEFWAPWCGPCRVLSPVVDELAGEYSRSANFVRVNVDNEQGFAAKHEVLSIPTMMVFQDQKVRKKIIGAMPKHRLLGELEDHLEDPDEEQEIPGAEETVALTWHEGKIKAVLLGEDGTYSYVSADSSRLGLVYLPKFVQTDFGAAIAELEALINDSYATKEDVRAFLQDHPDIILGGEYKAAHPQVLLRRDGRQSLQPDFVLEPISGELADIVDIEPAQNDAITEVDGVAELTDVVIQACARLRDYRDHFEEEQHRIEIEDEHGIRVFRPRMFVVIGRSGQTDALTQRRLETQLTDVTLRTWDDVLKVARERLDLS
jgi:thioredoxin